MLWFSRHYASSWIIALAFLLPGVVAGAAYVAALSYVDKIALNHRDNFISQLSR